MDFIELIKTRKSVRSFSDKPVSRELIEKIVDAGTYAPTNCNQQLWNFTVLEDASVKERLIKEAAGNTLIRRAPVAIVVSYDGWNYKEAMQGASLAVGHMLLAATHYGVGALPMNSYGADSKIKKILNIPDNQAICCFVLLGYPDDKALVAPLVPRRSATEALHWGSFSNKHQISFQYNPETWTKEDLIAHQKHYCRKTFLGKEMDIMSEYERSLVKRELSMMRGRVADYLSYDGAYVREFSAEAELTTLDLSEETALYTATALKLAAKTSNSLVFDRNLVRDFKTSTLIFKNERIPKELRHEIYDRVKGELVIIARKQNLFLSTFFFIIKRLFGRDVRKTGIFTFFGPYQPISLNKTLNELKEAGFKNVSWHGYFAFPAFYEQLYQMFLQFRASEGSSYLHREKRGDAITKLISWVLDVQGFKHFGRLGSVVVIKCHK